MLQVGIGQDGTTQAADPCCATNGGHCSGVLHPDSLVEHGTKIIDNRHYTIKYVV